jgi:hypothetical protein
LGLHADQGATCCYEIDAPFSVFAAIRRVETQHSDSLRVHSSLRGQRDVFAQARDPTVSKDGTS